MGIKNRTNQLNAELVDKYINTAYDNVKTVADNITTINLVSNSIDELEVINTYPEGTLTQYLNTLEVASNNITLIGVGNTDAIQVFVDGVHQSGDAFIFEDNILTFSSELPVGTKIAVYSSSSLFAPVDLTEINTVFNNLAAINTTNNNINNIITVNNNAANINTVAANISSGSVQTVVTYSGAINTNATNIGNIILVANHISGAASTDILVVASSITSGDIQTVVTDSAAINTVAGDTEAISAIKGIIDDSSFATVYNRASDIQQLVEELEATPTKSFVEYVDDKIDDKWASLDITPNQSNVLLSTTHIVSFNGDKEFGLPTDSITNKAAVMVFVNGVNQSNFAFEISDNKVVLAEGLNIGDTVTIYSSATVLATDMDQYILNTLDYPGNLDQVLARGSVAEGKSMTVNSVTASTITVDEINIDFGEIV
jgi:hypothetical protein